MCVMIEIRYFVYYLYDDNCGFNFFLIFALYIMAF